MRGYLGQHFLVNKNKIKKIVDALELKAGDTVIEIGPGHGELTLEIKNQKSKIKNLRIIGIEKDKKLAEDLELKIKNLGYKNIEIIKGDVLKILPSIIHNSKFIIHNYKIVGNIPYYITGYLLRILGELRGKPLLIVLTIQKEVAERITAQPPKMNLLAASVQFWAKPEIISHISKKDFKPQPKVDSAIIKLATRVQPLSTRGQAEKYYKFIKILFKQPRKTIFNNLQPTIDNRQLLKKKLELIGINPADRSQDLSLKQIIRLAKISTKPEA